MGEVEEAPKLRGATGRKPPVTPAITLLIRDRNSFHYFLIGTETPETPVGSIIGLSGKTFQVPHRVCRVNQVAAQSRLFSTFSM